MNAHVLVLDDGHVPLALVEDMIKSLGVDLDAQQPEDTGTGFMEFFDWLAGTSAEELNKLYRELYGLECVDLATNQHARERVGLEVWRGL